MKNNLNTTQTKPLFQLLHRGHLQKSNERMAS